MNQELLEYLKKITPEEEEMIRSRQPLLERYAKEPGSQVVDRDKMIRPRRMIDVMKQPRFIEVTEHTHNYLEMIYVVSGVSRQVIGGDRELVMKEGDLMFLRQGTYHTVAPAGYDDISVRFSILPEFLQYPDGGYLSAAVHSAGCPGQYGRGAVPAVPSAGHAGGSEPAGKSDDEYYAENQK